MGTTIIDAALDIFQGIAAMRDGEYSSFSAFMLVTVTWMGVGEEIIEGIFVLKNVVMVLNVQDGLLMLY